MARKKKRTQRASAKKRPSTSADSFGTLGDLLGRRSTPTGRSERPPAQPSTPSPPDPPNPPARRTLTEADLMAEAFAAAGEATLWEAKFEGRGFDARDVDVVAAAPTATGEDALDGSPAARPMLDAMTPEERMFLDAMGGDIERMDDRDRYADLSDHSFVGARWRDEVELTRMSAEELMEPTLTIEQRDTLKRSRRQRMPTLHIRHMRKAEALTNVDVFVRTARIDGHRFVRVIHGKGRQSDGDPVLKPAVIDWCNGPGGLLVRHWAPETDRSGNFGGIVLELRLAGR